MTKSRYLPSRRAALMQLGALAIPGGALLALTPKAAADNVPSDPLVGRRIVFDDDFASLDWTRWNAGPKATTAPSGFYGRSAFAQKGGDEGFNPYSIVDDPRVANGKALQIACSYIGRSMHIRNYYGNDLPEFQWVSGNMQGATPQGVLLNGWRSGYFEARMQFPSHPLTWPAFWLLNRESILNWQTSIEVDIIEHKGTEPFLYGLYLHEWGAPDEHNEGSGKATPQDMTKGYNRFGVLIEGNLCIPYYNRQPILSTVTGTPLAWVIRRAAKLDAKNDVFFPLLTLALRADVPFPNPLREEHKYARMLVDYFRVYQKK